MFVRNVLRVIILKQMEHQLLVICASALAPLVGTGKLMVELINALKPPAMTLPLALISNRTQSVMTAAQSILSIPPDGRTQCASTAIMLQLRKSAENIVISAMTAHPTALDAWTAMNARYVLITISLRRKKLALPASPIAVNVFGVMPALSAQTPVVCLEMTVFSIPLKE